MADSVTIQSGVTFALSAALATYVALQRPRTPLHHLVLAILGCFLAWTAGLIVIKASDGDPALARLGTLTVFFGVIMAPPFWLFLCARVARVSFALDRPGPALAGLLTPSLLTFAVVASDARHGLFAAGRTVEIFTQPVGSWAGPLFWVHSLWAYLCTIAGIVLCIAASRRAVGPIERKRLRLVAVAAAIPLVSIAIFLAGVLPRPVNLSPADLSLSAVLLVTAILRYRLLEPSPLPASKVLSHLHEGVVLADADGVIVDASPSAERLLGRPVAALRGHRLEVILDLLNPVDGNPPLLSGAHPDEPVTHTVVAADGRIVDVTPGRVADAAGRTTGSFLVLRDRTEQHRRERRRHQSQRLESLGVITAGIAHEINNPLAYVRTNLAHLEHLSELVCKHAAVFDPAEAAELSELEEVLRETQAGVDRIARVVEATRRLSREPSQALALVDLNRVAELTLELAALHEKRGVSVETVLQPSLPAVRGSSEQLSQVLLSLLINAKQAVRAGPGGRIRLETQARGANVEVIVHDDGPGVEPAAREQIFDPFFTTKAPDEGTGLGLAIAHEIAREHEGRLEVGDSDLGGARFALSLPVAAAECDGNHAEALSPRRSGDRARSAWRILGDKT